MFPGLWHNSSPGLGDSDCRPWRILLCYVITTVKTKPRSREARNNYVEVLSVCVRLYFRSTSWSRKNHPLKIVNFMQGKYWLWDHMGIKMLSLDPETITMGWNWKLRASGSKLWSSHHPVPTPRYWSKYTLLRVIFYFSTVIFTKSKHAVFPTPFPNFYKLGRVRA